MGLLQGLTEFFPVSSSAHLKLARIILGVKEQVVFDLVTHLGTLFALLWFLWRDIVSLSRQTFKLIVIATFPLVPFYFLLKPLRDFASKTEFLGFSLMITALILFLGELRKSMSEKTTKRDALWIGTAQATALIPGISRSASTITAARLSGWQIKDAVRFSFLLSIPTIIGGNCVELVKMKNLSGISFSSCIIGFISSFIIGIVAVRYAIRFLEKGNLKPFAWYCLILGITTAIYFNTYG